MAKTHEWDETIPAGSEQASTADDHFRRLRLEIRERMEDIVTDWSSDPVVLKPIPQLGKKLIIHSSAFVVEPTEGDDVQYGDNNLGTAPAVNPMRAALQLPAGVVISRMRALVTHENGQPVIALKSLQFDTALATSTICQLSTTEIGGPQMLDSDVSAPFSYTIPEDVSLFLVFDCAGGLVARLHAIELTFADTIETEQEDG